MMLPIVKTNKWSLMPQNRISLYGHYAKKMKNFTLRFDNTNQHDTLYRSRFGEMWFLVEKYVYQTQTSVACDSIHLDLEKNIVNRSCVLQSDKFEIQQMPYLTMELHIC